MKYTFDKEAVLEEAKKMGLKAKFNSETPGIKNSLTGEITPYYNEFKSYTVTGATGYIGYKVTEEILKNGDFAYAIVRESSDISKLKELEEEYGNLEIHSYSGEECDLELSIENSDYVIHLGALYTAAHDEKATVDLINSNILFSTQVFNVVNRVNPSAVIASASTFSSLDGEGAYAPSTLYAATKQAVEIIAEYYKSLSIRFLTFPDTYGSGDWRPKIHNILAKNEKWPFEFRSPSHQEMRMLHVEDIAGHIFAALEDKGLGVKHYDIYADGVLVTLKDLSEAITDKECLFNESGVAIDIPKKAREFSLKTGYINKHKKFSLK